MKTQDDILQLMEEQRQTYIDAALDIWDYAEPIFEEHKSAHRLAQILEKKGFTVTFGVADMPTAFIAVWGHGQPVIGYMGEFDALPNLSQEADNVTREPIPGKTCGHGCGHHLLCLLYTSLGSANQGLTAQLSSIPYSLAVLG